MKNHSPRAHAAAGHGSAASEREPASPQICGTLHSAGNEAINATASGPGRTARGLARPLPRLDHFARAGLAMGLGGLLGVAVVPAQGPSVQSLGTPCGGY